MVHDRERRAPEPGGRARRPVARVAAAGQAGGSFRADRCSRSPAFRGPDAVERIGSELCCLGGVAARGRVVARVAPRPGSAAAGRAERDEPGGGCESCFGTRGRRRLSRGLHGRASVAKPPGARRGLAAGGARPERRRGLFRASASRVGELFHAPRPGATPGAPRELADFLVSADLERADAAAERCVEHPDGFLADGWGSPMPSAARVRRGAGGLLPLRQVRPDLRERTTNRELVRRHGRLRRKARVPFRDRRSDHGARTGLTWPVSSTSGDEVVPHACGTNELGRQPVDRGHVCPPRVRHERFSMLRGLGVHRVSPARSVRTSHPPAIRRSERIVPCACRTS